MGIQRTLLLMAALASIALAATPAQADVEGEGKPHPDIDMEGGMARWMEVSAPGDQHKYLDRYFAGEWSTETHVWMEGPGSEPSVTQGTAESEWIMDGRFLRMESEGSMMDKPMRGLGITGFDRFRKHYIMYWIDNMSTTMYLATGNFDPSGMVLTMYGTMDEPMTGEVGKNVKFVTRIIDEEKHIFEIHDLVFGEENTKVVEIVYTRK